MARDVVKSNVMVGYADLYTAPANTTPPADTVAFNGVYTGFDSVGATEEGVTTTYGKETAEHRIEEDPLPAIVTVESATFTVATSLAEDTLESMALAYGGSISGTTTRKLLLQLDIQELALWFVARSPAGFRTMYIPRVQATGEIETAYRRSESKRLYPVTWQSVCAISDIVITERVLPAPVAWAATTARALGNRTNQNGVIFVVTTAGTTGATPPNWGTATTSGQTVTDASVTWTRE